MCVYLHINKCIFESYEQLTIKIFIDVCIFIYKQMYFHIFIWRANILRYIYMNIFIDVYIYKSMDLYLSLYMSYILRYVYMNIFIDAYIYKSNVVVLMCVYICQYTCM
jgi:hypothetical protein